MKIFDSKLKKKVDFIPMDRKVKIYVCGPTVYDDAHLGHARSAISFDLLKRVLSALDYEPFLVKNFTDIDDKIIKRAKEEKKTLREITELYTQKYLEEMDKLYIQKPDLEPKATQNIEAMTSMIERLLQKGFAYKTSKGNIYLDVQKDSKYGSISSKIEDETQSRVESDPEKRDPRDFALWKRCKDGEEDFCFKSEGVALGRPGWHIECSAMIEKLLDEKSCEYSVDIHGGGADLLFPHHENEASQMRCAHSKEIAKYWMHNGFVNINGEKMAKSLKNSFLIKDALEVVDGEVLRYYLISTHY
ncbi:MAG: cysteine--tRNA ligase, partial [Campylobacterales bacterium]